ncbi:MAG: SDR family NAD(P)-dependent oxidoreductase [Candidatus Dormibacteria bacterium]
MTISLNGSVALITGGSRGLGRALALSLARQGCHVSVCARGEDDLEAVAVEARETGADVLAVTADVGIPRDVERLAALTLERFGDIDILVNNASTLGPTPLPHLADCPPDALAEVFQINVVAPLRLTQAVLGSMLLRRSGAVLNVSSDAAVTGYPGWGAYGASKAALDALTRSFAEELQGTGVRVVSVDPGDMDTEMHRAAAPDDDPASLGRPEAVADNMVRLLLAGIPEGVSRLEVSALP